MFKIEDLPWPLRILQVITFAAVFVDGEISEETLYKQKFIFPKDGVYVEEPQDDQRRVLGGSRVPGTELPYVVAIYSRQRNSMCSGSIIAPTFVVTAAHCDDMYYVFKTLNDNLSGKLQTFEAKDYLIHPQYQLQQGSGGVTGIHNDIALLQTKENMVAGWVKSIPLSNVAITSIDGILATVAGFGTRGMFAGASNTNLQYTQLQLQHCPNPKFTVSICGLTPSSATSVRAVCRGDSGGPVILDGKLVGVHSLGPSFCNSFAPRDTTCLFTFVPAYVPWLQKEMAKRMSKASVNASQFSYTTMGTSTLGALVSKNIKNRESDRLKETDFEQKIIYQDVYYGSGKNNRSAAGFITVIIFYHSFHYKNMGFI